MSLPSRALPWLNDFSPLHEPAAAVRPEALLADLDAFLRSYPERMGYQDVFLVSIHGAVLFFRDALNSFYTRRSQPRRSRSYRTRLSGR